MNLTIPCAALRVLWHLESAGCPAYIVGGSLRDALMGKTPHDWDITTAALPEQMLEIFGASGLNTVPTGLAHGTVTVVIDHNPIECTTYRLDGEYTDARHPDRVEFTDRISDDLCRRDFTVNAMACRLPSLAAMTEPPTESMTVHEDEIEILDLYGGRDDLAARIIRCVGEPEKRFDEDALRMLRAVRFCVQLGFDIDPQTEAALAAKRTGLGRISVERIASELMRTLANDHPSRGLALMMRTGLWAFALPESEPSENPYFTSENELFAAVDELPGDALLRMALLLSGGSADEARSACRRLRLSNKQTETVTSCVGALCDEIPVIGCDVRRYLARYGEYADAALALRRAVTRDLSAVETAIKLTDAIRLRGDCLCVADLAVDGRTLMDELGLRGADVGAALRRLLDAVLEDASLNTREALLLLAKKTI